MPNEAKTNLITFSVASPMTALAAALRIDCPNLTSLPLALGFF